jgi:hypothetical protein
MSDNNSKVHAFDSIRDRGTEPVKVIFPSTIASFTDFQQEVKAYPDRIQALELAG